MSTDLLTLAEANCLCYAVRYALDRPATTAAPTVAKEVVRLWPRLAPWQQDQLQREVRHTHAYIPLCWDPVLRLPVGDQATANEPFSQPQP
jgi:hypothetical protein